MASNPLNSESSLDLAARHLHNAYMAACASEAALDDLRRTACAFVQLLRGQGLPPEQVIVRIKTALTSHARFYATDSVEYDRQTLAQRVVTWCIEEYYRPTD